MKCPNCGLINPESALRCDCGYDFSRWQIAPSISSFPSPCSRPFPPNTSPAILMIHVIASITGILIGGSIYILWRADTLLMFSWFQTLGMRNVVNVWRNWAAPYSVFPRWVYFSLPQGLWLFSGLLAIHCIWRDSQCSEELTWCSLLLAIAGGLELGQLAGIVPGRFDPADLVTLLVKNFFGSFVQSAKNGTNLLNTHALFFLACWYLFARMPNARAADVQMTEKGRLR